MRRLVAIIVATLSTVAIVAMPARATSTYDNKITVISQLMVGSVDGTTDLTLGWERTFKGVLEQRNTSTDQQMLAQYNTNKAEGGGYLVQSYYSGMRVITFDPDATVGFEGSGSGYNHLTFSTGDVCVWESGGAYWKNWVDLSASPQLQNYVSVVCATASTINPAYVQYKDPTSWPYLFIASDHLEYPVGYEGPSVRTHPFMAQYVAMGDSFSSGEGVPAFEAGTAAEDVNECHRSPDAYPRLLEQDLELSTSFVACSGAETDNVLYGGQAMGEGPQVDALSSDTEIVTITIGGNDIGFGDFARECLFPFDTYVGHEGTCDEFTTIYDATVESITDDLPSRLELAYDTILEKAPYATVYVVGYPPLAPYKYASDPFDQDCGGLYDAFPNTWGDARAAYYVLNLLNSTIEEAVDSVNLQNATSRLHFVDVTGGAFVGHDVCSSTSFFNGIFWPNNVNYTIHPNADGQSAYAEDVGDAMN